MPYISLKENLPGITGLLEYRLDTALPIRQLTHILLRGESTLTEGERELIATIVSNGNECQFCTAAHTAAANQYLDPVVAPYKGKVVYLDVWGTWCGPCREEMKYAAALKQHVDSSKVVFLYLDEDADEKDGQWREYVQMNNITGEHLRMNEQDIGVIWEALLPDSPLARTYPRFFIFGRNGKLVQANAKRPSDEEVLYNQLKEAIDAP